MNRTPTAIVLAALALAAGAASSSAHEIPAQAANTKQDRIALRRERAAVGLINKAINRVRQEHRDCRLTMRPGRPTFTDATPSDALLGAIGLLRRPATERDQLDRESFFFPFARGIYEDWVRVATASDGRELFVVVAQDRLRPQMPQRCVALQNAELSELLEDRPQKLRRVALRMKARLDRDEHPPGGIQPREAIFVFERTTEGGIGDGGGGVDLAFLRTHGLFATGGVANRSTVWGLVPDGVASIDFTFPRTASRGPHADPKVYPQAIHVTVPVQDNVVSFEVDRPATDAYPGRMTWRATDGSVVRVVRAPGA